MNLPFYTVKWLGDVKGLRTYYAFKFDSTGSLYNHYKTLILGSDDQEYAKQWFGYIKMAYERLAKA